MEVWGPKTIKYKAAIWRGQKEGTADLASEGSRSIANGRAANQ